MDWWRISKYDPALRDEQYRYTRDEWTSPSHIGRTFEGVTLDAETYLATETAHVEAVRAFMADAEVSVLTVTGIEGPPDDSFSYLEKLGLPDGRELAERLRQVHEGQELSGQELDQVFRLLLRRTFWCKLVHSDRLVVQIGEYLYIYIGTAAPSERAINRTHELGLFIEETRDPSI